MTLVVAHRGASAEAPENTMPAFEHAVGLGYRYLETDVHATADGELVAFHDDRLDRVTDGVGVVAELPWSTRVIVAVSALATSYFTLVVLALVAGPELRRVLERFERRSRTEVVWA